MIIFEYHHKGGLTFAENMAEPFILDCMKQSHGHYCISSISFFYALKSLILEERIAPHDVKMLYLNQPVALVHHDSWQKPNHFLARSWCYYRSIINEDKVLCVPIIPEPKIRRDKKREIPPVHPFTLTVNYNLYHPAQRADGDMYRQLKQEVLAFQNQSVDKSIEIGDELEIYALRALVAKNYIHHKNIVIKMPYTYRTKMGETKEGLDIIHINADANLSSQLTQKRDGIKHGDNIHYLQKNEDLMAKLHRQMNLFSLQEKLFQDLPENSEDAIILKAGYRKQKI